MDHDIGSRQGSVFRVTDTDTRENRDRKRDDSMSTSTLAPSLISPSNAPVFAEHSTISEYLYYRGYIEGVGSDVTVVAFGQRYALHKLILSRSSYFAALFSHAWQNHEADKAVELQFNHDTNIRQDSFELVLQRLYGRDDIVQMVTDSTPEDTAQYAQLINRGILATATFLDLPRLAESALDCLIRRLGKGTVASLLRFATESNYGAASKLIIRACRAFLFTDGFKMAPAEWEGIPNKVVAEVVTANEFYVPDEWLRCEFLISIYRYRQTHETAETPETYSSGSREFQDVKSSRGSLNLSTESDSVSAITELFSSSAALAERGQPASSRKSLRAALNHGIHYCHLTFPQLQELRKLRDIDDNPLIDTTVLTEALWLHMHLRHRVTSDKPRGPLEIPLLKQYPIPKPDPNEPGGVLRTIQGINDDDGEYEDGCEEDGPGSARDSRDDFSWTEIPPFRFSVKFENIVTMAENTRLYSRQVWYGGSFWRVYVQKCRHRKRYQLGVYLHRGDLDGMTPGSLARERGGDEMGPPHDTAHPNDDSFMTDEYNDEEEGDSTLGRVSDGPSGWGKSSTNTSFGVSLGSTGSMSSTGSTGSTGMGHANLYEYIDPRPVVSTYFEIYTPSKRGKSSLTCFSSAPDTFKRAQSWGWKSSSLYALAEECERHGETGASGLQFTVVVGTL
ncbi:hypothetical protein NADFUDRAFT_48348 [Nadsonia fulvescens var. elongata DSM 6958]|uniref:BTB domain-containing protein n=1 Tax=Nadsonia fulvescens var. elongata DSM 6958 TaxID=857566 RepID=A0A1E3PCN1_9ASCO|nr:hypothetical protein NADFUDRAFT_48348 [Nadsonia fulvescens var. elongata DSM 6958]